MLTVAKIRAAEPQPRPFKMADGQGLFLYVAPTGLRSWRMAFRYQGKAQLLTFGRFPELTLAEARDRRDNARRELRQGRNPAVRIAPAPIAGPTFADVARAWLEAQRSRWTEVHAADVAAALERHLFPAIGALPIKSIGTPEVLGVLRKVEQAGAIVTARRLRQWTAKIFRRARAEQLVDANPAAELGDALLPAPDARHQAAILDIAGARTAFNVLEAAGGGAIAGLALRFLILTAARSAAVRGARWDEIEDLEPRWGIRCGERFDMSLPIWRIPAKRMKVKHARKGNAAFDHVVPLSAQAVATLRMARAAAGDTPLIFPRRRGAGAPIGVNALSELHAAAGLRGRQTPHGWRATFATILNETRPADRAAIDLALAHSPKDKVEAAYNRSEQLALRRALFDAWADLISPI